MMSHVHLTRRSGLLAVAAGITLAVIVPVLPASAGSGTFEDTRDDVVFYDWEQDTYYENSDWDEVDIAYVAINASSTAVRVTTRITKLTEGWWLSASNSYDVDGGDQDFRLYFMPDGRSELRRTFGSEDFGTAIPCAGVTVSIDYGNSQFVTSVPRSCLGNTASVGVAASTYDDEGYDCDCNDVVMDFFPNQIGTFTPHLAYSDSPPPSSATYDPNGPMGTIYRLYRAYFLREPDQGGYDYWLGVYRNGYPLDKISNDFARSTEFESRYGSVDNRRFLELVYQNVLGRAPDQGGYDYWLDQMNRGMLRGYVMIYFSDSEEYRSKTADGRPPGY